ncbi:MAG: hypothetical protein ACPHQP_03540 [Longimicrobiales bacterium]
MRYVERLPDGNPDDLEVPDCFFCFPETVLVRRSPASNHATVRLTGPAPGGRPKCTGPTP